MSPILPVLLLSAGVVVAGPVERQLAPLSGIEKRPPVTAIGLRQSLDQAAGALPPAMRQALAGKPVPWLLKAHDVGEPTDFDKDIPWHLLDKEKDRRFDLPHRGKLGVFNTTSDISFFLGFGIDDGAVEFDPKRKYIDHLINLAAIQVDLGLIDGHVLLLPVASDTLLTVIELENRDSQPHAINIKSVCTKPLADKVPFDRYGYGVTATTGNLQWVGCDEADGVIVSSYEEWIRHGDRPGGSLLCTMTGSRMPTSHRTSVKAVDAPDGIAKEAVLGYRIDLPPGSTQTLLVSLNLHRHGPEQYESPMEIVLYPKEIEEQALKYGISATVKALGVDWPRIVAESFKWYERLPMLTAPVASWTADFLCSLELPRANTWSAQGKLRQPWYTLCRAHVHEPYGWWSYGMHGHEHLSTCVVNIVEPTLSQSFLRGHFQNQQPDGRFPYGVNHRGVSAHSGDLATPPFLAWEAWTAYLWSGDREFLREAYVACSRSVRWWCSPARTRPETTLQHWKDFLETVRDDGDLATWTATGKAQSQEALDLNCYLLNEERTLSLMAAELRHVDEAARWRADADNRTAVMRKQLWHEEDGVYYGRDLVKDRWARIMDISTFFPLWCGLASPEQARSITRLLHDPTAFGTDYPVATLAVRHMPEKLKGQWHWRGANWVEMSWLAVLGLKVAGEYDEAARLAEINCRMVFRTLETDGHFREYFNSLTGEPTDLTDYIWTSMPAIMLVDVILGIRPTADGVQIMPALPAGWEETSITDLRIRDHRLSVTVRRDSATPQTTARMNGTSRAVVGQRGVRIAWDALPDKCTIEIVQPTAISAAASR